MDQFIKGLLAFVSRLFSGSNTVGNKTNTNDVSGKIKGDGNTQHITFNYYSDPQRAVSELINENVESAESYEPTKTDEKSPNEDIGSSSSSVSSKVLNRVAQNIHPSNLFSERLKSNFPIKEKEAWIKFNHGVGVRLMNVLNQDDNPTNFVDPFWWFRGYSTNKISKFEILDNGICLMDEFELKIDKIWVHTTGAYWQNFVYLSVLPLEPVGIIAISQEDINQQTEVDGYASEEYALVNDNVEISRSEYDSGAYERRGIVYQTNGKAILRLRPLTRYNCVICAKTHPLIDSRNDANMKEILDNLLTDKIDISELVSYISRLDKPLDFWK